MSSPLIIGVTGGSGSGKSLFLKELLSAFDESEVCLITQDNYYKDRDQQPVDENGVKNFDLPESIDHQHLFDDIVSLKQGKEVRMLEYTFNNPKITPKQLVFKPAPVLIVEGILVFYWKDIREMVDLSVFIDATDLIKVKRRIIRDAKERGYDLDDVLYRYEHHVAPFYESFLHPLKKQMDLVIPNNTTFIKGKNVLEGYIKNHISSNKQQGT